MTNKVYTLLDMTSTATNVGIGLGVLGTVRTSLKAFQAYRQKRRLDQVAREHQIDLNRADLRGAAQVCQFAQRQAEKKRNRMGIGMVGGILGTAGAILGATPIGWGLIAAGCTVAVGLGIFRLVRAIIHWVKHEPSQAPIMARQLYDLVKTTAAAPIDEEQQTAVCAAQAVLKALGLELQKIRDLSEASALKAIEQKMQSW
jgi:hypothetical protein